MLIFLLGANTDNLPAGVLYQVKASYRYQAEDVDELNFDVGEVINVVEYEDPEEQASLTFRKNTTFQLDLFSLTNCFIPAIPA